MHLPRPRRRLPRSRRIGAIDGDARDAVAGRLVREHAHGRLVAYGRRQCRLVVLDAEDRRQATGSAQVDRLVPLAERRSAFADERQRNSSALLAREGQGHPSYVQRSDCQRSRSRQHAIVEIAGVQVLSIHRRAHLGHLRRQHHANGRRIRSHGERYTEVANHRRDDIANPPAVSAERNAAPQTNPGGVDRFLPERAKALPLKCGVTVSHLAAGEESLEPVVGRAGEDHAAEDLAAFVRREAGANLCTPEEPVAGVEEFVHGSASPLDGADAGRGFSEIGQRGASSGSGLCVARPAGEDAEPQLRGGWHLCRKAGWHLRGRPAPVPARKDSVRRRMRRSASPNR